MACTPSANPSGSITLSTYTLCRTAPQPDSQQNTPSSDPSVLSSRPGEDRAHRPRVSPIRAYRPGSLIPDACHGPRVRDTGRAMSEESASPDLVELTREVFEAVNRGDLDASLSFYGPDVAWDGQSLSKHGESRPNETRSRAFPRGIRDSRPARVEPRDARPCCDGWPRVAASQAHIRTRPRGGRSRSAR